MTQAEPPPPLEPWICNEHRDDGCGAENLPTAKKCHACGMPRKPPVPPEFWECNEHRDDGCGALNESHLKSCHACGMPRNETYSTTLEEVQGWREGVIARGDEIDELEVMESEGISEELQTAVIRSGNPRLMRIFQLIPEEMYASVEEIYKEVRKQQAQKR